MRLGSFSDRVAVATVCAARKLTGWVAAWVGGIEKIFSRWWAGNFVDGYWVTMWMHGMGSCLTWQQFD